MTRGRIAAAFVAIALVLCAPAQAFAANKIVGDLSIAVPGEVRLEMLDVVELPVECSPSSITVGVKCGMTDMCGLDPCLCGKADEYGACACNGRKDISPSVSGQVVGGSGVLVANAFGRVYLVGLLPGEAQVDVLGQIEHYNDDSATTKVAVGSLGVAGVVKIVVAVALVAALVLVVRWLRRRRCAVSGEGAE